ncbi:MarR family winged helix-turn-helix transcriptional regulator [Methanosphaera sp.]
MSLPTDFTMENIDNFPVSFIFSTISRQHSIYLKHELEPYAIAVGEYPIIMSLYHEDKKTQKELADAFHITEGTIARTVKHLEDKELIEREINEKNRRQNFVYLTEKGTTIARHIENMENEWQEKLCAFLNEKETTNFKQILYQLTINSIEINEKY